MCGIFAYNGKENSIPLLIEGLRDLEYRGYDSAGIVGVDIEGNIFLEKAIGKVSNLATKVARKNTESSSGGKSASPSSDVSKGRIYTSGIAHTRWATHGGVTKDNTHPHYSQSERFFIVHNGIIENYKELKEELSKKYKFYSDTDSEVVAKLYENLFDGDHLSTITKVTDKLVGAYALAIIDKGDPTKLIGTKLGSPMIIGISDNGVFLSSDINALGDKANEFITLEDNEIVIINSGEYSVYSTGEEVEKVSEKMEKNYTKSTKGDFETFTEKEINEVPEVIENVFMGRIDFQTKSIHNETLEQLNEYDIERIEIIASGSSYFAGFVGCSWFRELSQIPTEVRISNEFLYERFLPNKKTLYIFMSQSGETADVRECVKMVKSKGCLTFGIVNVVGSTIARSCDMGLFSHAGIEVGVASTKNIIGQLGVLLLMSISMGLKKDLQYNEAKEIISKIGELKSTFEKQLKDTDYLKNIAKKYSIYKSMFFLGRNILYGVAQEGSLKLKELSGIHSEAYGTGEMKHGPLALINQDFPCIFLNIRGVQREKTISNIKEVRARNGKVLGIITNGDYDKELYDDVIEVPEVYKFLTPFVCLIPMWLLSVYIAKELGKDVDKPQNLAKSVTVE